MTAKPCPFCGGPSRAVWESGMCRHVCESCGARTALCDTPHEALERWNCRAGDAMIAAITRHERAIGAEGFSLGQIGGVDWAVPDCWTTTADKEPRDLVGEMLAVARELGALPYARAIWKYDGLIVLRTHWVQIEKAIRPEMGWLPIQSIAGLPVELVDTREEAKALQRFAAASGRRLMRVEVGA